MAPFCRLGRYHFAVKHDRHCAPPRVRERRGGSRTSGLRLIRALDAGILDHVSMAGDRFDRMLKVLTGI